MIDIDTLRNDVENFSGATKQHKEYMYTKNCMIHFDIESHGFMRFKDKKINAGMCKKCFKFLHK